jgi:hypothetical protein
MSAPPTQSAYANSPGFTDNTAVVSPTKIDPNDVPEFERPQASQVQLTKGNNPNAIAHSGGADTTNIAVDDPKGYTAAVQAHELAHNIQHTVGGGTPADINAVTSAPADQKYDEYQKQYGYGGADGLAKMAASGKTIGSLNMEQQASIPSNYMKEYLRAEKSGDAGAIDKLNKSYEPAIKQLRNMADKDINVTPDAPGAPPASITGLAKPLQGMASNSTPAVQLTASQVHNPPPNRAASGLGSRPVQAAPQNSVVKSKNPWYAGASGLAGKR